MTRLGGVSAVVPACDEAENIAGVVGELLAVLPAAAERFEVVVVDDGSRDRTPAVLADLSVREGRVRAIRHRTKLGYGAALRSGFAAAREPWVFFTDGDGQFAPGEITRLLALAEEADIVAGYRHSRADPWHRRASAFLWNFLVRALFALPVRDVNCAFKLIRAEVLRAVPLESTGALVNTELLARAVSRGFRVREVPVSHFPRRHGTPTGGRPGVVLCAFRELFSLAGHLRQERRRAGIRPRPARLDGEGQGAVQGRPPRAAVRPGTSG